MLEFYADDAGVRVLDGGLASFEVKGKAEVAKYLRAVYARPASHHVENGVVAEEWIRFEESCEYPDGARTVVETSLKIRDGEISRQVGVVGGRDGSSGEPELPAVSDLNSSAPSGESPRDAAERA
jgi:hypothetical protein